METFLLTTLQTRFVKTYFGKIIQINLLFLLYRLEKHLSSTTSDWHWALPGMGRSWWYLTSNWVAALFLTRLLECSLYSNQTRLLTAPKAPYFPLLIMFPPEMPATFYLLLNKFAVTDAPFSVPLTLCRWMGCALPALPSSEHHTSQRAPRTLHLFQSCFTSFSKFRS